MKKEMYEMYNPDENENLPKWVIPMTWQMSGSVIITAKTLEEAMKIAESNDGPAPNNGTVVSDSYDVFPNCPDYIRNIYNNGQPDMKEG